MKTASGAQAGEFTEEDFALISSVREEIQKTMKVGCTGRAISQFKEVMDLEYRKATEDDIPRLCQIRKQQLIDEGAEPGINIDDELALYFSAKLGDNSLVEWLLEENGDIIATAAIVFMEFPPSYTNRTGIKGYIANVYTSPAYRGQGIATSLLGKLICEAKDRGVQIVCLEASKFGKPVYRRFGFSETDDWMEMSL